MDVSESVTDNTCVLIQGLVPPLSAFLGRVSYHSPLSTNPFNMAPPNVAEKSHELMFLITVVTEQAQNPSSRMSHGCIINGNFTPGQISTSIDQSHKSQ